MTAEAEQQQALPAVQRLTEPPYPRYAFGTQRAERRTGPGPGIAEAEPGAG